MKLSKYILIATSIITILSFIVFFIVENGSKISTISSFKQKNIECWNENNKKIEKLLNKKE